MEEIDMKERVQRMVKLQAIEIIRKLKIKIDWYYPIGELIFDLTYILHVIKGTKKESLVK